MTASSDRNTIFTCVVCNKSLNRFSWKTYRQTKQYSYQFKCRYCGARYEQNFLGSLPSYLLLFFLLVKLSGLIGSSNPFLLLFFLIGLYGVEAMNPVKKISK